MRYRGVLFDLFGTLIAPFRRREHTEALRECSRHLKIDFETCHRLWGESFERRILGGFHSVTDNFSWIARQAGAMTDIDALTQASEMYLRFTTDSIQPLPGVLELLDWLASTGARIGLVTNCAPDIPLVWPNSSLAPYFHACAFSCHLGVTKPDLHIYRNALAALGIPSSETLYVGDGSDRELTGAADCGMQPVLITVDLSNTYDSHRPEVDAWRGPTIRSFFELRTFME